MNRKILLFTLALALAAFVPSCTDNDDSMPYIVTSYATYQNTDSPACFVTDDSIRVVPTNDLGTTFSHGARVWITFNYDAKKGITNPLYAEISSFSSVMQGGSILSEQPDTLGTVGADLYTGSSTTTPVWRCGGIYGAPAYINLLFLYLTNDNGSIHWVNLSYPSESCDTDGYFHMKFSHKINDVSTPSLKGQDFCSFSIPEIAYAAQTKGLILTFDGLEGSQTNYRFTFSNSRLEKL